MSGMIGALKGRLANAVKTAAGRRLPWLRTLGAPLAHGGLVAVFHRVNDAAAPDGMTASSAGFRAYCAYFRENFSVVSLRGMVDKLERHEDLRNEIAITFDDGYLDNHAVAAPILEEHGLTATFFITTACIGSTVVPWWDQGGSVSHPYMEWRHVRSLRDRGFDIGSHTRTHADLGVVSGDAAREEIFGSRREIEERLEEKVDLFAFPYGFDRHMSEENRLLVKEAGYRCCCSYGPPLSKRTDPFRLGRIPISAWFTSPEHFGGHALLLSLKARASDGKERST